MRLLTRYVDNILVIYDTITTNENRIINYLNSTQNKIKFFHDKEINNTINYLDLIIEKENLQMKVINIGI